MRKQKKQFDFPVWEKPWVEESISDRRREMAKWKDGRSYTYEQSIMTDWAKSAYKARQEQKRLKQVGVRNNDLLYKKSVAKEIRAHLGFYRVRADLPKPISTKWARIAASIAANMASGGKFGVARASVNLLRGKPRGNEWFIAANFLAACAVGESFDAGDELSEAASSIVGEYDNVNGLVVISFMEEYLNNEDYGPQEVHDHRSAAEPMSQSRASLFSAPDIQLSAGEGRFTFEVEGVEGGRHHSRVPHVPSNQSGLTIGRGYDMSQREAKDIYHDLREAGLSDRDARLYSQAAHLKGSAARGFMESHPLVEISPAQQQRLFDSEFAKMKADVIRIINKPDVIAAYGQTDWRTLHPAIQTILVDLRYRGDYRPETRSFLQRHIVNNDLQGFLHEMSKKNNWPNVPEDRAIQRINFLRKALSSPRPTSSFGNRR